HDLLPRGCEVEAHVLDRRRPEPLRVLLRAPHQLPVILVAVPAHEPRDVRVLESARVGAPDALSYSLLVYEPPKRLIAPLVRAVAEWTIVAGDFRPCELEG